MKITKVLCGLLTGLVIFLAIPIDVSAAYKKDIVEKGDGRTYYKYEVTTYDNNKEVPVPGTDTEHPGLKGVTTKVCYTESFSHTKNKTAEYGVGMSKGIVSAEAKWGFSDSKTFKCKVGVAFYIGDEQPAGSFYVAAKFKGVKVNEKKTQCCRTGNDLPFGSDNNVTKGKDKEKVLSDRTISYVPNSAPEKALRRKK